MKKLFLISKLIIISQILFAQVNDCSRYECSTVPNSIIVSDNSWEVYNLAGTFLGNSKTVCPPTGAEECSGATAMWHGPLRTCPTLTGVNFVNTNLKFRKVFPVTPAVGENECWKNIFSYCLKTNLNNVIVTIGGTVVPPNGSYQLYSNNPIVEIFSYGPNTNWNNTVQPYISFVGTLEHPCNYKFDECDNINLDFKVAPIIANNVVTGVTPIPDNSVSCSKVYYESWNISIIEDNTNNLICLESWDRKKYAEGKGYTFSKGLNQWLIDHGGCANLLVSRVLWTDCGFKKRFCKTVRVCLGKTDLDVNLNCNCQNIRNVEDEGCLIQYKVVKNSNEANIFPNPANEKLIIKNTSNEAETVSIFSINGALIRNYQVELHSVIELNTSSFENGIYIIKSVSNSGIEDIQKVLISH